MTCTPNTNCLAGMRCPKCGNKDEFRIEVSTIAKVTDDGIELVGDTEWSDKSFCMCPVCEHDGFAADFTQGAVA